jgi:hypothetical protein
MAKSTKSKGRNTGPGKGAPAASGRAQRQTAKGDAPDEGLKRLASPSAKEAAAKAVSKGPAKGGSTPLAKAGGGKAAGAKPAGAKPAPTAKKVPAPNKRTTPPASARYTPPIPKSQKVSPLWVPILMFACLGLGMLIIVLNYVNVLPGANPSNAYLMIGLALITVGFITATKYH